MAGITLAQAEAKLAEYQAAESKALSGQSYSMMGRTLTRADLSEIRKGVRDWDIIVKDLDAKASRKSRAVNVSPNW